MAGELIINIMSFCIICIVYDFLASIIYFIILLLLIITFVIFYANHIIFYLT